MSSAPLERGVLVVRVHQVLAHRRGDPRLERVLGAVEPAAVVDARAVRRVLVGGGSGVVLHTLTRSGAGAAELVGDGAGAVDLHGSEVADRVAEVAIHAGGVGVVVQPELEGVVRLAAQPEIVFVLGRRRVRGSTREHQQPGGGRNRQRLGESSHIHLLSDRRTQILASLDTAANDSDVITPSGRAHAQFPLAQLRQRLPIRALPTKNQQPLCTRRFDGVASAPPQHSHSVKASLSMADEMVLQAQRFFNITYSGYAGMPKLTENGQTSWSVMYALTRALQLELLVSPQSDSFGPGTLAALTSKCPSINENTTLSGNF